MYDFATLTPGDRRDLLGLQAPDATGTNQHDYARWVEHHLLLIDAVRRNRSTKRRGRALRRAARLRRQAQRSQVRATEPSSRLVDSLTCKAGIPRIGVD